MADHTAGVTIVHTIDLVVATSSRRHARAISGGFHTFLSDGYGS